MEKIKNYTVSIVIGYAILMILFLITSCIFAYTNIQDKLLDIGIYISLFVASFISSILFISKEKKRAIISGSVFGILFYGIIFVTTCILSGFSFSINTLIYFIISIISSIVGCIIGVSISS